MAEQEEAASDSAPVAPLSLTELEENYPELFQVYKGLSDRQKMIEEDDSDLDEDCTADSDDRLCTEIMCVDFLEPLHPQSGGPIKTDSVTNKFTIFVWKMLDACESGGIGGDACRQASVLAAATNDVLALVGSGSNIRAGFDHLLGLTAAISAHGAEMFFERGDHETGRVVFAGLGNAWKQVFEATKEDDSVIGSDLRQFAVERCEGLQKYLKSTTTKYSFNFIVR